MPDRLACLLEAHQGTGHQHHLAGRIAVEALGFLTLLVDLLQLGDKPHLDPGLEALGDVDRFAPAPLTPSFMPSRSFLACSNAAASRPRTPGSGGAGGAARGAAGSFRAASRLIGFSLERTGRLPIGPAAGSDHSPRRHCAGDCVARAFHSAAKVERRTQDGHTDPSADNAE
jgi:hypothetical protein